MLPDSHVLGPWRPAARWGIAGLILLTTAWLGYALGRGQSLADVARLNQDANTLTYTLDSGQLLAQFERTGGDLKPEFRAPDGTPLLDLSDWDYSAAVEVDGQRYEFVRLVPSATVDYPRKRIVAGLSSSTWVLGRDITLDGNTATVRFTFLANTPVHDVRITIAHTNWYYLDVHLLPDGFTAGVTGSTRAEMEAGLARTPKDVVTLTTSVEPGATAAVPSIGLSTPFGVEAITTAYALSDPTVGQLIPLATERVTWRPE